MLRGKLIAPGRARTGPHGINQQSVSRMGRRVGSGVARARSERIGGQAHFKASNGFRRHSHSTATKVRFAQKVEQERQTRDCLSCRSRASRYRATTTGVPTLTLSNRSTMSWLYMRMQPYDAKVPIEDGLLVP